MQVMAIRRMSVIAVLLITCLVASAQKQDKSPGQLAWDDLRWLATALEAYSTDNESLYGPPDGPQDGVIRDLDQQLNWYYDNTAPAKPRPAIDPWGHPYRFAISKSRKAYALYSSGPDGRLDARAAEMIDRLKRDAVTADDLAKPQVSASVVVISGTIAFAPEDVLKQLRD